MTRRLVSAGWIRIRRHWLARLLLGLLLLVVALQLQGKADHLLEVEAELETIEAAGGPQGSMGEWATAGLRLEADSLRENLQFPAVVGYGTRLATDFGWFFVIVLTAVWAGDDFARGTLCSQLARGVGRAGYLVANVGSLSVATGAAVLAVVLLSAALGPALHNRVSDAPIALDGLPEALAVAGRVWLASLPFVIATLFWVVLGRRAAPAAGVGLPIRFLEFGGAHMFPILVAAARLGGQQLPAIYSVLVRLYSVTLGFGAETFIHWGAPIIKPAGGVGATELVDTALLPTSPWRGAALLVSYSALFLGWAVWILRRRDLTRET
jgi:hypothetical protein